MPRAPQGLRRRLLHTPLPTVDQDARRPGQRHRVPRQVLRPRRPHEPHRRRPRPPPPRRVPIAAIRGVWPDRESCLRLRRSAVVRQLEPDPGRRGGRAQGRPDCADALRRRGRGAALQGRRQRHTPRLQGRRGAAQSQQVAIALQAARPREARQRAGRATGGVRHQPQRGGGRGRGRGGGGGGGGGGGDDVVGCVAREPGRARGGGGGAGDGSGAHAGTRTGVGPRGSSSGEGTLRSERLGRRRSGGGSRPGAAGIVLNPKNINK